MLTECFSSSGIAATPNSQASNREAWMKLRLPIAFAFLTLSALGQSANTLNPPPGWESWPLADDCITATAIYARRADKDSVNKLSDSKWYYFESDTPVRLSNEMDDEFCALVQVDGNSKAYGWVATALLLKPTPRRLAILAQAKREAEAERDRVARMSAKAKREAEIEKDRVARMTAHAEYLKTLPIIDNGNPAVFLGADRKCSEQFVQALSMDGLEKRKKMTELVTFGCGFLEDQGSHVTRIQTDSKFCLVAPAEGKYIGRPGWVPCSWVK